MTVHRCRHTPERPVIAAGRHPRGQGGHSCHPCGHGGQPWRPPSLWPSSRPPSLLPWRPVIASGRHLRGPGVSVPVAMRTCMAVALSLWPWRPVIAASLTGAMAASNRGRPPSQWPWQPVIAPPIPVAMVASLRFRPPYPWPWRQVIASAIHVDMHGCSVRPPSLWPWRLFLVAAIPVAVTASHRGRPPFQVVMSPTLGPWQPVNVVGRHHGSQSLRPPSQCPWRLVLPRRPFLPSLWPWRPVFSQPSLLAGHRGRQP